MPTITNKILGQAQESIGNTAIDLYTVPASTMAIVTVVVCAVATAGGQTETFRLAIAGAGSAAAQLIHKNVPINALGDLGPTIIVSGLCLGAGDVVRVASSTGGGGLGAVFTAYGQEIS